MARIESVLDDGKVRILDLGTNSVSEVSIADLRARASIAEGATIDAHLEAARGSGEIPWQHAKIRERAVAELIKGSGAWGERAVTVAQANGVSPRTLYRWLARYRDSATTSSLIPLSDGAPRGARRLDATREILVNKIIEQQYLSRTRPSIQEIVRLVGRRCVEDGCKPISRNAIRARILQPIPP